LLELERESKKTLRPRVRYGIRKAVF